MAAATVAGAVPEAVAAREHDVPGADGPRGLRLASSQRGGEQLLLVGQQCEVHQWGADGGPRRATRGAASLVLLLMNRPVRTRMPGGVGGERRCCRRPLSRLPQGVTC